MVLFFAKANPKCCHIDILAARLCSRTQGCKARGSRGDARSADGDVCSDGDAGVADADASTAADVCGTRSSGFPGGKGGGKGRR